MDLDHDYLEFMVRRHMLRPFWPKDVDGTVQSERLWNFFCLIFPIWVPIVRNWTIAWKPLSEKFPSTPFNEVELIHKCDIAIYDSGIKPDRGNQMSGAMQQRKDSVLEKARRAS